MIKKIAIITLCFVVQYTQASSLTIPNSFSANTPAVAAQVNANFNAVETSVDDNDARLTVLEGLITQLQNNLTAANATIAQLQNNTVLELDGYLQLSTIDGHDTAEFTGVNVQINNGTTNQSILNGLGNLIVGYNPESPAAPFFCSDPQYTDSVSCIGNLETWEQNVRTGSHNLIIGRSLSYTEHSAIIAGDRNVSNGGYASVLGGRGNIANGIRSSILGGRGNITNGQFATISGGFMNITNGLLSSISGGSDNTAGGTSSHIGGGRNNNIPNGAHWSSISGGNTRSTTGFDNWVGGSLSEVN